MLTVGFKKCCKYRTYSIFGVFRFLLSRGIYIHLPSQENEIQNLSQQPTALYIFLNAETKVVVINIAQRTQLIGSAQAMPL